MVPQMQAGRAVEQGTGVVFTINLRIPKDYP